MIIKSDERNLACLKCLENISYIRKNQREVVSWFGFRTFDIHRQMEVAKRLKAIRYSLSRGDVTFREMKINRLEWHYRVWRARKHRLLRCFYIRAQIFMLRHFPHLHSTFK